MAQAQLCNIANLAEQAQAAARVEVQRSIFTILDADLDGRLNQAELQKFAELMGFDGDDVAWKEEFDAMLESHGDFSDNGIHESGFRAMLDDQSDDGFYCKDSELEDVCGKLVAESHAAYNAFLQIAAAAAGIPDSSPADMSAILLQQQASLQVECVSDDASLIGAAADTTVPSEELMEMDREAHDGAGEDSGTDVSRVESDGALEQLEIMHADWEAPSEDQSEDSDNQYDPIGKFAAVPEGLNVEPMEEEEEDDDDVEDEEPLANYQLAASNTSTAADRPSATSAAIPTESQQAEVPLRGNVVQPGLQAEVLASREALRKLRQELLSLGTPEAAHNRQTVPNVATRVAQVFLPAAGTSAVLGVMAAVFGAPGLQSRHRLVIAYVFHDLLVNRVKREDRADIARDGTRYFLDRTADVVSDLSPGKREPFMKLLHTWTKARLFPGSFLKNLKQRWAPPSSAATSRLPLLQQRSSEVEARRPVLKKRRPTRHVAEPEPDEASFTPSV